MVDVAVLTAPALSSVRRVELVQTGDWIISSGRWKAARDDLVAAVAALDCPAVRRPIIKLGHSQGEEPLWQGNPTGAPAIGWIDNLAPTNHGHTLVGDLVGMPGWLATPNDQGQTVIASAWPDRSVEGRYDFRCQVGHTHPFVITAVSLLGVTPPGVGTLRSLQDVGRLYGVGAAADGGTRVEARFDPNQLRDDDGRWTDGLPGLSPALDKLKLARRIQLGAGETFAGSDSVDDAGFGTVVPVAAVRTPAGPRLRIGTGIADEDRLRWAAADRGSTANLDAAAASELRGRLDEMVRGGGQADARGRMLLGRVDVLDQQRRDINRRRHPQLSATKARQVDRIDRRTEDIESRRSFAGSNIQRRVDRMPPDVRAEYERLTGEPQRDVMRQYLADEDSRSGNPIGLVTLYNNQLARLSQLDRELASLRAQRQEITGPPAALSHADEAELARVTDQLQQAQAEFDAATDRTVVEGVIPGRWADLSYEVDIDETGAVSYRLQAQRPGEPDLDNETRLTEQQLHQLDDAIGALLDQARKAPVAASAGDHVEGFTLGDSEAEVDLWADGAVTLGWGEHQAEFGLAEAEDLVGAMNQVRGGEVSSVEVDLGDGMLGLALAADGGVQVSAGDAQVLLSDDDAFDLQDQLVDWVNDGEVQARAFDPAKHPRWPAGTPGGLGGKFMRKDLVPRLSGGTGSRSQRRTTPPAQGRRRRVRTGVTTADQARTIQVLTNLDQAVQRVPGTRRGRSGQPSLSRQIQDIRTDVDTGDITPDEAQQRLAQLVFRPDVANDPRLSGELSRAVSQLRDSPDVDAPAAPTPARRQPAGLPEDLVANLRAVSSSEEARTLLAGLSAAQLKRVADEVGTGYASNWRKQQILHSIVQRVVGFRETFEAIMRGGGGPGTVAASGSLVQVAAAADVHTGAMVALMPSEEDIQRLAVVGGEPVDQLHTTLLFLGEADAYPPEVRNRILDELRAVADVIPPGEVDGFATSIFNPTNPKRETAIVLLLSGDGLEDVHGLVAAAVEEVTAEAGLAIPEQHSPWQPHLTLRYTNDLTQVVKLVDRTGPLRFDRLRVAFAGENVDIPLTGEGNDDIDLDVLTDDDMPEVEDGQVVAQQSRRLTRSDRPLRRYWLRGAGAVKIRWNTPGDWTRCVRATRRYLRDPKAYCAVLHREATGVYPGDRRNVGRVKAAFDPDQPRDPRNGQWIDVMHPATDDERVSFRQRFGKAIPPAWTDVHIADDLDNAPLLVIGRDGKGRRQAIYSSAHTEGQAAKKFQRVKELDRHLDKLDHAVERDAPSNDDAAALLLIRRLGMRPGSTRDTHAEKQAFGATTLQARHVTVSDGRATLDFIGKEGVHIRLGTTDPAVVDMLSRRLATRSGEDRLFNTTEARTRDYMRSTGVPGEFLLKDLRTVHANAIALREMASRDAPKTKREFQQARRAVGTAVSRQLGNTPTLALSSYVNPAVFASWVTDPSWVAAATESADADAAVSRAEEKRLLATWFATVTFDQPETGIPAIEPDPDDEDDDGRTVNASEEEATLPNPNPTIIHAAAQVSVDDVRTAYYRQAPQQAWIREFHTSPQRLIVANDADGTVARVDFEVSDDGQIRFGEPKRVRVEYVEDASEVERERVTASRMVYASAAESRPSATVQAHATHNQKTHGNRYGPDGKLIGRAVPGRRSKGSSADTAIRNAYSALARGDGASIEANELDGLLKRLTGGGDEGKRANLANLDVGGYGTLFATDKADSLDRSKMPQLGTSAVELQPFLDVLQDRGVRVRFAEIDPTTLKPSQNEISGAKTGKLAGFMAKDGWLPGGLLVTSNDGYVVDGHHRWSGAAAVRASGQRPDMTVTGLVVDAPIDDVLQLAASVANFESLDFDRTAVQAAAVSDRPWSDFTEADFTVEQLRRSALIVRGDGSTKEQMSLPVREPDGTLNRNAVHAAAGGHGVGAVQNISPEERRFAARKLVRLYRDELGDEPPESLLAMASMSTQASAPDPQETPAAEPGNPSIEEEIMPLSTEVHQRLGLADDADEATVNAAVLALAEKADQAPDPQTVAAAAAENETLTQKVTLLSEQVENLSKEIADANAEKAADVKASVIDEAVTRGRIAPTDKEKWEGRYDKAPDAVADVLASIADGTAVPVSPQGKVGDPQDVAAADGEDEAQFAEWDRLFSVPAVAVAGKGA